MAEAVFRCFFPGRVRLFGKTGSHSRESRAALRVQMRRAKTPFRRGGIRRNGLSAHAGDTANKKQKLPHRIFVRQLLLFGFDMYPQYWVSSMGGTYHFCLFLSLYSEQHFRCFQFV